MATKAKASAGSTAAITLPLTAEQHAAYQALYDQFETTIENTSDVGVLEALNASQLEVANVLNKDDMYRLEANTKLYGVLMTQIKTANGNLQALQKQILAISTKVSTFATILGAITKVLKVVPIA